MPDPTPPLPPVPPPSEPTEPPAEPSPPDVPPNRPPAPAPTFLPFDAPRAEREATEGRPRRGCHPLVFGVVMATIQLAATLWFMGRC